MSEPVAGPRPPLIEVQQRLDQIVRGHPAARLLVDMARDATNEAARQQAGMLSSVRRLRRQRDRGRQQAGKILDALAASPVMLRPRTDLPTEAVLDPYRQLRQDGYPAVAKSLHELAGKGEARDFQVILVDQVLRLGQRTLTEAMLRKPDDDRAELRERLRHHLGGRLLKRLARAAGCRVTPPVGAQLDGLVGRTLTLLEDLLATNPSVRLFWPEVGEHLDASLHERGGGKAAVERRSVRAVLFPGLRAFGPMPGVLQKALVATKHTKD
jgi:hypothetical protein